MSGQYVYYVDGRVVSDQGDADADQVATSTLSCEDSIA